MNNNKLIIVLQYNEVPEAAERGPSGPPPVLSSPSLLCIPQQNPHIQFNTKFSKKELIFQFNIN